jgi:hypothetical protein
MILSADRRFERYHRWLAAKLSNLQGTISTLLYYWADSTLSIQNDRFLWVEWLIVSFFPRKVESKNDIIAKNFMVTCFLSTKSTLTVIHSSIEDIHKRVCSESGIIFSLSVGKHDTPKHARFLVPVIVAPFLLESAVSPSETLSLLAQWYIPTFCCLNNTIVSLLGPKRPHTSDCVVRCPEFPTP